MPGKVTRPRFSLTYMNKDNEIIKKEFPTCQSIGDFLELSEKSVRNLCKGRTHNYRKAKKKEIFNPVIEMYPYQIGKNGCYLKRKLKKQTEVVV